VGKAVRPLLKKEVIGLLNGQEFLMSYDLQNRFETETTARKVHFEVFL
jgi:hypothetical protein